MSQTNAIEVKNLVKTYGDVYALKNVDLNIADGEYFVLLGPSGVSYPHLRLPTNREV